MNSDKPPVSNGAAGINASNKPQKARFTWLNRALPAFHCILIGIAFTLASFRFFITESTDRYKCHAMLNDGQWLDEGLSARHSIANWQPDGCMAASYNSKNAKSCLGGRTVLFMGDSIIRRVFLQAIHILDPEINTRKMVQEYRHSDMHVLASGVDLQFHWSPYLNTTRVIDVLERKDVSQKNGKTPALLVLGTGLWELLNLGDDAKPVYIAAIDRIIKATTTATDQDSSKKRGLIADEVVLYPVERTYQNKLKGVKAISMTVPLIDELNEELMKRAPPYATTSTYGGVSDLSVLYVINKLIESPQIGNYTNDGVHYENPITRTQMDLMLNLRCNDVLPKKFPFDKTCCMQYPAPNWLQILIILFALIWAPLGTHYYASNGKPFYSRFFPPQHVLLPMTIFSFSCVFMYFTDRTSLYLKIQKQFDFWQFTIAMLAALALGVGTMKKPEKDLGFLNRDQTDEWKGWMQIAILIYHYYAASRISGIYNPIRVLVASYLFMSGYGHFFFYYKKADYGLARVAGVLVRLNLLTLALAYIQDTDYLSYYFSPLVTLWFGIIWVTMYIGHNYNKSLPFMLGKICVSAALMAAYHKFTFPLQTTFAIFNAIFKTEWNAKEWGFRVTLDMWIVYIGMLAAFAYIKIQEEKLWERQWWSRVRSISYIASALGMVGYFAFELRYNKFEYNQYHPYVSFVPVLSFIVLRNATPLLRSTSSRAFIWIGQCSLETFICQFHLWLAGDTKGLLVLLPWPRLRFLNMLFTTLIFLFVSNHIAISTGQITEWICGKQPKKPAASLPNTSHYIPLATMANSTGEDGLAEIKHVPSTFEKLLADLRFRLAICMGLIWIINLLYPSYHPSQGHLLPTH